MTMSDYIPIDCALYSRYELTILHRQRLRVAWHDPDGTTHVAVLQPIDLQTRQHAEYLLAKNASGALLELRLDRIVRAQPC